MKNRTFSALAVGALALLSAACGGGNEGQKAKAAGAGCGAAQPVCTPQLSQQQCHFQCTPYWPSHCQQVCRPVSMSTSCTTPPAAACAGTTGTATYPAPSPPPAPTTVGVEVTAIDRIPRYSASTGYSRRVDVTLTPATLPAGRKLVLRLSTPRGTGRAVFLDDSGQETSTLPISRSRDVRIKGLAHSLAANDVELSAHLDGQQVLVRRFSVRTWPTNFRRLTAAAPQGSQVCDGVPDGILSFAYGWDSESGRPDDLHGLLIGETVHYPGTDTTYYPPSPPWGSRVYVDNPTIIQLKIGIDARADGLVDNHKNEWGTAAPYQSDGFIATQTYWFRDEVLMTSPHNWDDVLSYRTLPGMGPYYIRRDIYNKTARDWVYRVEKDGCVEEVPLP